MAASATVPFSPALLIVDLQQDFCPPDGSLAVAQGRDVTPHINKLLSSPAFSLRVATRDWHPHNHISFADNHPGKKPFVDTVNIVNPLHQHDDDDGGEANAPEAIETRLWPVHCVQNTPGAQLIPELDASKLDTVIDKGTDPRVEMYSPFFDPFTPLPAAAAAAAAEGTAREGARRVCDSGLADVLASRGVTHVYVVGLAADYCVQSAAVDAMKLGYVVYVVEEATRAVDPEAWEDKGKAEMQGKGVKVVSMQGEEVRRVLLSP